MAQPIRSCMLLAAGLLGAAALAAADATTAAADECSAADALLDSGAVAQVQQAAAEYGRILAATPGSACAAAGGAVAGDLVAAVDLHRAGQDRAMLVQLADAIRLRPQARVPAELLPPADADRGFRTAAALERAGFHDAAVQVLQQTVTAQPDATPPADVRGALNDVRPAHRPPWLAETWQNVSDWLTLALVAAFLVSVAGWETWRWRRGSRLLIGTFTCSDGSGSGIGFAAAVGDCLQRMGEVRTGQRPDRIAKWGDPITVPTGLAALPQAGLISALLELVSQFLPSSDRSLTGTLHLHPSGVVGASFSLETRSHRVLDGDAVWSSAYGLPPAATGSIDRSEVLYPLAYPVAVWAFWKLAEHPEKLGTSSWRSYALFGMGSDFDAAGDPETAQRCYLQALADDPANLPARLNLASMWLAAPPSAECELDGRNRATWARGELETIRDTRAESWEWALPPDVFQRRGPDGFWFRAQYVLTSHTGHRQLAEWQAGSVGEAAAESKRLATDLVVGIQQALAAEPADDGDRTFQSFLRDIQAPAMILWAGVRMLEGGSPAADLAAATELVGLPERAFHRRLAELVATAPMSPAFVIAVCEAHLPMPARARYNLACYHAVAAMLACREGRSPAPEHEAALLQLRLAAPGLNRSMLLQAGHDPCFADLAASPYAPAFREILCTPPSVSGGSA